MREIKFRVKSGNKIIGYEKIIDSQHYCWILSWDKEENWRFGSVIPVIDEILEREQFIGKRDKNGKEIFENDTIKAISRNTPRQEIIGKIVYDDGEYEVETTDNKWPVASITVLEDFEVIG